MNLSAGILVHRMLEGTVLAGTVIEQFIAYMDNLVWGPWMLVLLLGSGCYLTLRLDLLPLKNLKFALRCAFGMEAEKGREDSDGGTGEAYHRGNSGRRAGDTYGIGTQTGLREHDGTEEAAGMREDSVNTDTPQAEDPPARFLLWLL